MRQGTDHARDALAASPSKSELSQILSLYGSNKETTLFERLSALCRIVRLNAASLDACNSPARPELSVRDLREKFRPFLKARFMKDHELKNARDILSKMERMQQDDSEYPELYLQASAMLEDFEILKFKRKGDDAEEIVEEDALAKLKGRFGRLK
jgi:hypothetical protein